MNYPEDSIKGMPAGGSLSRGVAEYCLVPMLAALTGLALMGLTVPIRAEDTTLEPIIVTAPAERIGDVVIDDHAGTHSRIDGERLERRDISLDDVLAQEAGIQRARSGGYGSFASITVRAASPAQTQVLLDGVRLNSAGRPVIDLSMLDSLTFDAIDVYRSVSPLQFGGSSIGGAVNLVTPRTVAGESQTRIGVGAASFGLARAELTHRARYGRWDTVTAFGASNSRNDFSFVDDNGTPLNDADDRRERRQNAAARQVSVLLKLSTEHSADARTDLLFQLADRRLGVPEFRNNADNDARFDTRSAQWQLSHARRLRGNWKTVSTLFLHGDDDRFQDLGGDVGLGVQDTETETHSIGLDNFASRALDHGSIELGAGLRRDALVNRNRLNDTTGADAGRLQYNVNAQWTRYLLDGRMVLSPALRLQYIDDSLSIPAGSSADAARNTADHVVSSWLPSVGLRFDASDHWTWRASLQQARREPSFAELYVDRGLVLGNPDLRAERGIIADAGINWRRDDDLDLSASVFFSARDELIVRTFDAQGVGRAINTGKARVRGFELTGSWYPHHRWQLSANATFQDAENISSDAVLNGKQLPGEAQWQWQATARFRPRDNWQLRVASSTTRKRFYDQPNSRPARDSTVLDIGVDYTRGRLKTAFAINNLGDDNVEDFNGFPRPGRAFSLNFSLTL